MSSFTLYARVGLFFFLIGMTGLGLVAIFLLILFAIISFPVIIVFKLFF